MMKEYLLKTKNFLLMSLTVCGLVFNTGVNTFAQEQGHDIKIAVSNYSNDTLIVGNYYADRQIVHDTLISQNGEFHIRGNERLKPGMYLAIFKPDNNFIQFMVSPDEQAFSLQVDVNNLDEIAVEGSIDNQLFFQYIDFIQTQNAQGQELNEKLQSLEKESEEAGVVRNWLNNLSKEVEYFQSIMVSDHPNTLTARLLKSNFSIDVPEFDGEDDEVRNNRYHYYKRHFFDHIELGDSVNLRMPFLHQKVTQYVDNVTAQIPDSIITSIDIVLDKMKPSPETFRFYLSYFLNHYAKSKQVGMDGIYVHLVENYYAKGMATWVDAETLEKLIDNAAMLKPTIIGKRAQNITTSQKDGSQISLYDIEAEYVVLYIFAYDCPHCKKSTPHIVDMYNKYKDKDVKVMTICTKRELEECWEYTEQSDMGGFYNTVDPFNVSRYRTKYDVRTTPKIYILDRDKKILLKNFAIEKISEVMEEVMKVEESKKNRKS